MADLADVERMVDDWERDAVAKSQRYQQMQAKVEQISITESQAMSSDPSATRQCCQKSPRPRFDQAR